MYTTKEKYMKR